MAGAPAISCEASVAVLRASVRASPRSAGHDANVDEALLCLLRHIAEQQLAVDLFDDLKSTVGLLDSSDRVFWGAHLLGQGFAAHECGEQLLQAWRRYPSSLYLTIAVWEMASKDRELLRFLGDEDYETMLAVLETNMLFGPKLVWVTLAGLLALANIAATSLSGCWREKLYHELECRFAEVCRVDAHNPHGSKIRATFGEAMRILRGEREPKSMGHRVLHMLLSGKSVQLTVCDAVPRLSLAFEAESSGEARAVANADSAAEGDDGQHLCQHSGCRDPTMGRHHRFLQCRAPRGQEGARRGANVPELAQWLHLPHLGRKRWFLQRFMSPGAEASVRSKQRLRIQA